MKLVAPNYELLKLHSQIQQFTSKNIPKTASKATLAIQPNLSEFRIPNLGKYTSIRDPGSDPKCFQKPSVESVGSDLTSKLSFETILDPFYTLFNSKIGVASIQNAALFEDQRLSWLFFSEQRMQ